MRSMIRTVATEFVGSESIASVERSSSVEVEMGHVAGGSGFGGTGAAEASCSGFSPCPW
jgi:hypothetical protein